MKALQRVFSGIGGARMVRRVHAASAGTEGRDHYVIRSRLGDVDISRRSPLELLWEDVGRWPDKVAIECAETRKKYTYHELLRNTRRLASALANKFGVQRGDVVAIVLPNMPEFAVAALGTVQAGGVVATMNPIYTEFEFHHQFSITRPKVIVTNEECYAAVSAALDKLGHHPRIIIVDRVSRSLPGAVKFSEVAESGEEDSRLLGRVKHEMSDLLFLPFSSGTTGMPKAVQISTSNIVSALHIVRDERICLPDKSTANFQEVVPCVLPFFHIYGLVVLLLGHLARGCRLVTLTKFNAEVYLRVLKDDRASLIYVVPPLAIFLGKSDLVTPEHLASARYALSGAAPLSLEDIGVLIKKTQNKMEVIQAYGATETTSLCSTMAKGSDKDYSGVGHPVCNTDLRLVCPMTGKVVSPDQEGELQIRGPQVSPGYYKDEASTRASFSSDGFYSSGDLASYSDAGGLQIKDRLKELIKVKGLQVAPAELEGILSGHPDVLEAAVVGEPHETLGEAPRAFVVPRNPSRPPKEEELKEFVATRVAPFKKIHRLQLVKELPKTMTGKILRRKLVEMFD